MPTYSLTRFPGGIGFLKQGMTSYDGLSPDLWHDCPLLQMIVDPTLGVLSRDDFVTVQTSTHPYRYSVSGTNGTFAAVAAQMYGQAKLTTGTTANDECYVTDNANVAGLLKMDTSHKWWFEARVQLGRASGIQGVFVGLAGETAVGADFMTDSTMALKVIDVIGFQVLSATDIPAIWQTIIQKSGGSRTAINASAASGSTNFVKLGMKSEPNSAKTAATITYWVNGAKVSGTASTGATNFPLNKLMQVTFGVKTGSTAAASLIVDWWQAAQLR